MITMIAKKFTNERIAYVRVDDERVKKQHYTLNGDLKKEKIINVREVHQNRRSHRNTNDFFEDMVYNYDYAYLDEYK